MQYISKYESPLGEIVLASDGNALTGCWFTGQKYFARTLSNDYEESDLPIFRQVAEWLDCYFSGCNPNFTPPLYLNGTAFQVSVWRILQQIPYGKVVTYSDIAKEIAHERGRAKMSAQAVGGAVGNNPISIIVPCHRVIGSDGSLTGYAGGVDRKAKLLNIERAIYKENKISSNVCGNQKK